MRWSDPKGLGAGKWMTPAEVEEEELSAAGCRSVGYVYRETEDVLILFSSLSYEAGELNELGDGMVIPKVCVESMVELAQSYPPIMAM